jgi:ABC-type multidrug transport system fused ATPase/permease subunit
VQSKQSIGDVVLDLRTRAFRAAAEHDLSFYDQFSSGRIVSRITSDTNDFGQLVVIVTDIGSQVVQAVILGVVLFRTNLRLSLLLVGFLPVIFAIAAGFRTLARRVTKRGMKAMSDVNAAIKETIRALAAMATLIASIGARSSFLALLRENPSTLRTLVGLFGTSTYLTQVFLQHPELLDSLVRADLVQVDKDRHAMRSELTARLEEVEEYEDRLDIVRRFRAEEFLRIGINDCNGLLNFSAVNAQLTGLAEACLTGAHDIARAAFGSAASAERLDGA